MKRILIVEDSRTQAQELRLIVEERGFATVVALDAETGLERFQAEAFDIVLSDVVMPGMSGYDLCRQIKALPKGKDTPVILLTTLSQPTDVIRGLECGADNFITKPYEPDYLLGRVDTILGNKALRADRRITVGIDLLIMGKRVTITSEREQILDVLMSTFEELIRSREREEESRITEQAARQSKQFLQSAMDALTAHIAILDGSGVIVAVNAVWPAFAQAYSFLGSACGPGARFLDHCAAATGPGAAGWEHAAAGIRVVLEQQRPDFAGECRIDGPDGPHWFQLQVRSFADPRSRQVVVAFENITQRKRNEERQAAQHAIIGILAEARTLAAAAPQILEVVCTGVHWDAAALWTRDDRSKMRCLDFWASPAGAAPAFEAGLRQVQVQAGENILGRVWHSGKALWFDLAELPDCPLATHAVRSGLRGAYAFPVKLGKHVFGILQVFSRRTQEPDEQLSQMFSVVGNQISHFVEHHRLEEHLQQAQKMEAIGTLAGGVAHDFNNLLTVINGYSELMLSRQDVPTKAQDFIREINRAGQRAASLTRQLLAFSRKQAIEPVVLDVNAIVSEMDKMLRRLISEDIDLIAALDPDLARVTADAGQLEQVLMNLAVNARDAMPDGGKLTIETHNVDLDELFTRLQPDLQPGKYVEVGVTDTGTGMDEQTKQRIFEPFFTTKESGKGTGLGLATVYGIVKQNRGHITVYSELGRGTSFKLYLPAITAAPAAANPETAAVDVPRGNETVLVVEDDSEVRNLARLILEANGYRVLAANGAAEAMTLCDQHPEPIHLLLTDVVMPEMSGRQLQELMLARFPTMRVLFMSGFAADAIIRHGVLDNDTPFISKPFSPSVLAKKVAEVLRKRLEPA